VALARDMESLQDKMAPFPQAAAERIIEGRRRPLSANIRVFVRRSQPPPSRNSSAEIETPAPPT